MAIEDKTQLPPLSRKQLLPFSPEDEKKAQQELNRLRRKKKRGFDGKTLWDWLQLLGVPIFLALATIGFSFVQFYLASQQHQQDQNLAQQQHDSDQRIANQQQGATIVQTFIANIQDLLLNHNLLKSNPGDEVAILARARALTNINGLDPGRKSDIVNFLYETHLISFVDGKGKRVPSIIDLNGANLEQADLSNANLPGVNLSGARLNNANLSNADLSNADLSNAQDLTQQQLDKVYSCKGATLLKG